MAKLAFRVDADTSPVKKFRTEIEQIEKTMLRIKGENFSFNHWLKEFDRLKTELEKKRAQINDIKKDILTVNPITDRKKFDSLNTELSKSTKERDTLIDNTINLSNKFGKAYDDLVTTLGKAQKVTDEVTARFIEQKQVVANLQSVVRSLNAEYRNANKGDKVGIRSQITSKQKELEQQRVTLNALKAEQERAKLVVKGLSDETRNYEKVAGKVSGTQAEANLVMGRFEQTLLKIGGLATLQSFASDVIRVRGEFQKTQVAFETMLGSKEKADALMSQMIETAAKTPFDLQGVADGAKQLLAYGTEAEDVNDTLVRLGNIASGLSIPLGDMVYLYGTMQTQGRLFTQDVRQFMGRGIPLVKELATMLGKTEEEINNMVTAGQIGFPEVEKVIRKMTDEGGQFYNLMEKQSQTLSGQISNLGDAWEQMLNSIGEGTQGLSSKTISMATIAVEHYEEIGRILIGLIATYGVYRAALMTNIALTHSWAVATRVDTVAKGIQTVATNVQTVAQLALNSAMKANPLVLVTTLVMGAAAAMWVLADHTSAAEEAQKRFNEQKEKTIKKEQEHKQKLEELISTIQNEYTSSLDRVKAINSIKANYPSLFQKYIDEKGHIRDLIGLWKEYNEEVGREKVEGNRRRSEDLVRIISEQKSIQAIFKEKGFNFESYTKEELEWYKLYKPYDEGGLEKSIDINEKELTSWKKEVRSDELAQWQLDLKKNTDVQIKSELNEMKRLQQARKNNKWYSLNVGVGSLKGGTTEPELQSRIDVLESELISRNSKSEVKNKTYWEKQRKEAQEKLDALTDIEAAGEKGVALKNKINEYDKKINAFSANTSKQEDQAKEQENLRALQEKQSKDTIRQVKDLEFEATQSKINAMDEGSEKTIAQMRLDHEKEIETLKRNREDYLQKKIDAERSLFESNPKNKGKSFDSSNVFLSKDEEDMFKNMLESTITKQGNDISSYYKELLSKYQGYAEKRLAIQNKFQQERDALVKAGASKEALAENDYQRDETLQSIDNEFAMREDSFKAWADNIADLSLEKLRELLVQAEQELQRSEFLNPNDSQLAGQRAKVTSLKNTISEKAAKNNTSPDKRSKKEWQDLYNTLSKVEREFDEIGRTVGGTVGEIISAAGTITTSTLQMIDGITTLANSSSDAMAGTAQAASKSIQAVEKASVILAIVGAALQITMKMFDLFGGDNTTEKYEKTKETYESYINILDKVIDKQLELAESLSGDNANAAYEKAIELVKTQSDAARVLGKQYLNSGSSWKSHSKGYSEVDDMSWEGWNDAAKALGMSVDQFKSKMGGRMEGLFDLTDEQLEKLQAEAHIFWAQLDSDTQNYANQIAEGVGKVAEVMEQRMTDTTLIDVDTLRSDFQDLLTDMDANSADFADNFEEYMRNAILNSMLKESYMGRLEEWRKKFYAAMDDGVTEQEYNDLKEEGQQIADDMKAEREAMADMFGWKSESSSQEATAKGFQAMSQDTGDELNGRFTALQVAGEEIKNQSIKQTDLLSSINEKISLLNLTNEDIPGLTANIPDIAGQTGESITSSYQPQMQIIFPTEGLEVLADKMSSMERIVDEMRVIQIEKFTDVAEGINRMTKNAPVMNTKLDNINENIKKVL